MSSLSEAISEMRNMREAYDQLAAAQASLAENVQAIKDAHIISGIQVGDVTFIDGFVPTNILDGMVNSDKIKSVKSNDAPADMTNFKLFQGNTNLESVELEGVVTIGAVSANGDTAKASPIFKGCSGLKRLNMPDAEVFPFLALTIAMDGDAPLIGCSSIEWISVPKSRCINIVNINQIKIGNNTLKYLNVLSALGLTTYNDNTTVLGNKLIDLVIGASFRESQSLVCWLPSVAMEDDSVSLLTQEDIAAGFENNRQKLLYNIRQHIAANLTDRAGLSPYTITFHRALRNIFDQETDDAFAAKNWDIAPARS